MLVDFGTSKMGTQTLMQVEQADDPMAQLTQAWLGLLECDMLRRLHVFLLICETARTTGELCLLHVSSGREWHEVLLLRGKFPGKFPGFKVPL